MKYKKDHVGMQRHPEIYTKEHAPVYADVKTELKMWKVAEKILPIVTLASFY